MLQTLTMDTMKIDRSILLAAERDPRAAAILESVIQLGRSLGMHVLTEGIETPEQEALLRRLGCACGQGYLYAKPMPQEEFDRFLETHLRGRRTPPGQTFPLSSYCRNGHSSIK